MNPTLLAAAIAVTLACSSAGAANTASLSPPALTVPVVAVSPEPVAAQNCPPQGTCAPAVTPKPKAKPATRKGTKAAASKPSAKQVAAAEQKLIDKPELKVADEVSIVRKYLTKSTGVFVENGVLRYPYEVMQPVVVCKPFFSCDITLEPGEKIASISPVAPTITVDKVQSTERGQPPIIEHLLVTPNTDEESISGLTVFTDRRVYSIVLRVTKNDYMPRVGFYYPRESVRNFMQFKTNEVATEQASASATPAFTIAPEKLDTAYSVSGDAPFKPIRVFNDGQKTYIQFPSAVAADEIPAIVVSGREGVEQTNWRLDPTSKLVTIDRVAEQVELVSGVGKDARRITISRGDLKPKPSKFCLFDCEKG